MHREGLNKKQFPTGSWELLLNVAYLRKPSFSISER